MSSLRMDETKISSDANPDQLSHGCAEFRAVQAARAVGIQRLTASPFQYERRGRRTPHAQASAVQLLIPLSTRHLPEASDTVTGIVQLCEPPPKKRTDICRHCSSHTVHRVSARVGGAPCTCRRAARLGPGRR